MVKPPTPHPDVNAVLAQLLTSAQAILGQQLTGMYLYGSLSSGDFDPKSSDIDFAVVTEGLLTPETIAALQAMHQAIWASELKWAAKLEGAYLPKSLVRRHDPDGPACPSVNEGAFYLAQPGSDWIIQRHVIRESGVILHGPDPKTLIDPVSAADIRASIRGVLREWWFPMLADPAWLRQHGSEYHAYAVVTMCRVLHGLHHGTIVSKPAAARWVGLQYPQWRTLIEHAIAAQHGSQPDFSDEALDMIRFVQENLPAGPENAFQR